MHFFIVIKHVGGVGTARCYISSTRNTELQELNPVSLGYEWVKGFIADNVMYEPSNAPLTVVSHQPKG